MKSYKKHINFCLTCTYNKLILPVLLIAIIINSLLLFNQLIIPTEIEILQSNCFTGDRTLNATGTYIRTANILPTGSMSPLITSTTKVNIYTVTKSDVTLCDIIVYNTPEGQNIIHRVLDIRIDKNGTQRYITAGDNNKAWDTYFPTFKDIQAEVGTITHQ